MTAPTKQQEKPKEAGPPTTKRQQILANAANRRMVDVLSQTHGLCRVVAEFDVSVIRLVCTDQELAKWARMARRCAKTLRAFAARAKETK